MNLKKIRIKRGAEFRPHSRPTIRIIRPRLRKAIEKIKPVKVTGKGKYAELKAIAKHFNVKLRISYNKKGNCGWCYYETRTIHLLTFKNVEDMEYIFCHELAHILQGDLKYFIKRFKLSLFLREEQEAESAAVEIYKRLFPNKKFCREKFANYFSEPDVIELYHHCKTSGEGIINDLFEWQKQKKNPK
jgi:hypothetical protein